MRTLDGLKNKLSKKYNFSVTIPVAEGFNEKFEATGCDSFDEAINTVEKAVKDRMQVLAKRTGPIVPTTPPTPTGSTGPTTPPENESGNLGEGNY